MNSFYTNEELKKLGLGSFGKNVCISKKASLYSVEKIKIGNNVRIDDFCLLSGKITIGNYVHIAAYVGLYAGKEEIFLENFSGISSRCVVYAESNDYSGLNLTNPTIPEKYQKSSGGNVILRKHSILGSGCTVLPNVTIGEGASIGAMSLVIKNVEPWSINVGIPSKKIKERSKKLLKIEKEMLQNPL